MRVWHTFVEFRAVGVVRLGNVIVQEMHVSYGTLRCKLLRHRTVLGGENSIGDVYPQLLRASVLDSKLQTWGLHAQGPKGFQLSRTTATRSICTRALAGTHFRKACDKPTAGLQ